MVCSLTRFQGGAFSSRSNEQGLGHEYQVYVVPNEECFPALPMPPEENEEEAGAWWRTRLAERSEDVVIWCFAWTFLRVWSAADGHWAGATYAFIDRMVAGELRHYAERNALKKIAVYALTLGRSQKPTVGDIWSSLGYFGSQFWNLMRVMINEGYVREETRDIDGSEVTVYFPTEKLILMICEGQSQG